MKLSRPKIGDKVVIINPEFAIRIGYPLTVSDFVEPAIKDLQNFGLISNSFGRVYNKADRGLINALAYYKLAKKGFGGNERKLFTVQKPELAATIVTVQEVFIKKEGTRFAGYGGSSHNFYEDAEPPSFQCTQTHRLLKIDGIWGLGSENKWPAGTVISDKNVKVLI